MDNKNNKVFLERIFECIKNKSYVIACFTSKVEVGFCYYNLDTKDVKFSFEIAEEEWNHILQLHIFNNEKEFRAVRRYNKSREENNGCLCIEKADEENREYIDQKLMLIPKRWNICNVSNVFLKVRNYISYNENGMVQIDDYRLVSFIDEEGEEVIKNVKF